MLLLITRNTSLIIQILQCFNTSHVTINQFANVELVGGNFMIGDFELDYSSQAAVVFDQ